LLVLSAAVAAQTASSAGSLSTAQPQTSPQPASDAARRKAYTKFIEAHSLRGNHRWKEAIEAYRRQFGSIHWRLNRT
jgi:hypothetical protein